MKLGYINTRVPLFLGIGFLLFAILSELSAIMLLNKGLLVYTLDDPYIHMAVAENIMMGHYGINNNEFSAPSSSILWPFILAPFSSYEYFPFLVNVAAAIVTVYIFMKILYASLRTSDKRINDFLVSSFLILLILGTNIIGLIFTGMEHSLQVLVVSVIAYGLIIEIDKNKVEPWLLVAIIGAPLIRYENLAISIAALSFLVMSKHFKLSVSVTILLIVFVAGFSLFLVLLGLDPFPTSVLVKSNVVSSDEKLLSMISNSIISNLKSTLVNRQGIILLFGVLVLLSYLLFAKDAKKKKLAFVAILAAFLHFIAGHYGHYHRYEIYIWTFIFLIALYLLGSKITKILEVNQISNLVKVIMIAIYFVSVASEIYIYGLVILPIAANNIYEQQYQMHRFAVDYYGKPVAVNDIGYVSYKNNNYVLDLWGLASAEALNARKNSHDNGEWMQEIAAQKNVELAMIYEEWFKNIPNGWKKLENYFGEKADYPCARKGCFLYNQPEWLFGSCRKTTAFCEDTA